MSAPINLLLADARQALFDAVKADDGAGSALRYETGRAVGLMGDAMDTIKALTGALQDTMEALAMCQPRTDHGARCQSDAMLKARAAIAKAGV